MNNRKILPVALVAALLGGTVGAFVMRPSKHVEDAASQTTPAATQSNLTANPNAADQALPADAKNEVAANNQSNLTADERDAYRAGFTDGVKTLRENGTATNTVTRYAAAPVASRVVYRPATRTRYARSSSPRRAYYDYSQPRGRSFWQKHRDKLTVAAGTGGGALLGGLIGGKKGAAIGALSGAGGSALYTYKIRKRNRRF
ncbi:MAG: hypothetical protein LC754_00820 [Acidobacteria bacterium]|nr:hypothetical protein [Acidobacteriota bacterium]